MDSSFSRFSAAGLALALVGSAAGLQAQVIYNNASTVGESYSRGMADVVRSQGVYNLTTSQAAINMTQAQAQEIQNRGEATKTYFEMRRINKEYQDANREKPPTMEQVVRFAQEGKPKRLGPSELDYVSGKLRWPSVLMIDDFAEQRKQVDQVFAKRAEMGVANFDDQMQVRKTATQMMTDLKQQIQQIPSNTYMAARRFLESVTYEAQQPSASSG
jgi:hypothetical protein